MGNFFVSLKFDKRHPQKYIRGEILVIKHLTITLIEHTKYIYISTRGSTTKDTEPLMSGRLVNWFVALYFWGSNCHGLRAPTRISIFYTIQTRK